MSFSYGNYTLADLTISNMFGSTGLGISTLNFSLTFSLVESPQSNVKVRNIRAAVYVAVDAGGDKKFLGIAEARTTWEFPSKPAYHSQSNTLCLDLSDSSLVALERLRNGHGLSFQLDVSAVGEGEMGLWPLQESKSIGMNLSRWVEVLKQLGSDEYLVVGIPMPTIRDPVSQEQPQLIRRAQKALLNGHYADCVAHCRLLMEGLIKVSNLSAEINAANLQWQQKKSAMTKRQRELVILDSVKNYSNLAHHVNEDGNLEVYSRDDALMLLAVTVGTLSLQLADREGI